jgi:cytochrome c553
MLWMSVRISTFLLVLTAGIPSPVLADAAAGRAKATVCVTCHGPDGMSRIPNAPHIAGQPEVYLSEQLKAYRAGTRKDPMMAVIAKPLTDQDIANLAAWYSSIQVTATLPP